MTHRRNGFLASLCFLISTLPLFAGPLQREPNTTLQMPPAPPATTFTATNAFPSITFSNPIGIFSPPGETNRLFVVEKRGRIVVITNLAAPTRTIFMDITDRVAGSDTSVGGEEGLLGLAFHPGYLTNRYFYVYYTSTSPRRDILARFETSPSNPNQGMSGSELRLISQTDEASNHNAGELQFGPDGYLYLSLGDEGGGNNQYANAQFIDKDFFSAILRIDVDKKPGSLVPNPHASVVAPTNYAVPPDNPFIGATSFNGVAVNSNNVRTEFWAVGMRNPWRMSFDPATGTLYCADVGQSAREEINVIEAGKNYGWAFWEGFLQRTNPTPAGFVHAPPVLDYPRTEGIAVVGGFVYRGANYTDLHGAYVYGDYGSGRIWALRHSGTNLTQNTLLFTDDLNFGGNSGLSSFGIDPRNGDLLYADEQDGTNGRIKRIVPASTNGVPIPTTLAQTGAFSDPATLTPNAGIEPYDLNVPFWSDNAIKTRWFSVPNTNLTIGFNPSANWSFPTGTVWIKHFDLELTNGVPASKQRLETRFIVKNAAGVYGVTYRWGNSMTNADIVAEAGMDESFVIYDNAGGIVRTQVWHYPSRTECLTCHTPAGGFGLGFNTAQLNLDHDYSGTVTNQILALSDAGYFAASVTNTASLPMLAHATNTSATLEHRSRSYLAANCVQCHQPGGSAQNAMWDARFSTPTALAGIINGPLADNFGSPSNRVIKPLVHTNSVLLSRISVRGPGTGQMPPLATSLVDTQNVALITDWISSLSNLFWLGVSPESMNVVVGANAAYNVGVLATDDFTDSVTLSVSGLPANVSHQFNPPIVTGSTNSTLTIVTSNTTPTGTYALTISGVGGDQTNTAAVMLTVGVLPPPAAGTLIWTGNTGDTNWSAALNWTNVTAGTFGPPAPSNHIVFNNTGAAGSSSTINNIVNSNLAGASAQVLSLAYTNTTGFHTTLISSNVTLALSDAAAGNAVFVGTGADSGANQTVTAAITGAGGTLSINRPNANVNVRQGGAAGTHQATLNLSGLDTFNATISRLLVAGDGGVPVADNRLSGVLYLARTNLISIVGGSPTAPAINIGDHPSQGRGNPPVTLLPSFLYLGQTNALFANTITVGRQKAAPVSMLFNPAFLGGNPAALFRGTGGLNSRVTTWSIGDNSTQTTSNQASEGTNDFTGGTINALVSTMYVGRGETGAGNLAGTGTGTLTFNQGTVDVDTLEVGYQSQAASASAGIGTVNVNGTGTLAVNGNLRLAFYQTGTGVSQGTLAINGGTAHANIIVAGGGISTLRMSGGGVLVVTNTAGTPASRITAFNLTNSTLRLKVAGNSIITNVAATTVSAGGVNTIVIDSVNNVTATTTFPLISYSTLNGSVAANFVLGALPPGFAGSLVDNTAGKTIDLVLTHDAVTPTIQTALSSETNLVFTGTNGAPNWTFYLLAATNLTVPLTNWSAVATGLFDANGAMQFTNGIDPAQPQQFYRLQLP